jgi:hypothetical protein
MPDFLSAEHETIYASPEPEDEIACTIELNHITFEDGPVRVVTGQDADLTATLEDDAPFDGGEAVLFKAVAFQFILPGSGDNGPTRASVKIDNASGEIAKIMALTITGGDPVEIIYREYDMNDLSQPGLVYTGLLLKRVQVDPFSASGEIGWHEIETMSFPRGRYDKVRYPSSFVL